MDGKPPPDAVDAGAMAMDAEGTEGQASSALALATEAPGGLATAPDVVVAHSEALATVPGGLGTQPRPVDGRHSLLRRTPSML